MSSKVFFFHHAAKRAEAPAPRVHVEDPDVLFCVDSRRTFGRATLQILKLFGFDAGQTPFQDEHGMLAVRALLRMTEDHVWIARSVLSQNIA